MAILNTTISSTPTQVFQSGIGTTNAITTIIVCNKSTFSSGSPSANQSLLYMYAVPNGGTANDSTLIVNGLPIPAGETVSFDQEKMVLEAGDSIYAKTDSLSNLVVTVSTLVV